MSGGIRVVVDSSLLENILKVAEGLNSGFVHVGGHLIVECLCECSCCLNNPVFRGDRRIYQILCLKKAVPKMRVMRVVTGQNFQH
jgi:hypothetical protein